MMIKEEEGSFKVGPKKSFRKIDWKLQKLSLYV